MWYGCSGGFVDFNVGWWGEGLVECWGVFVDDVGYFYDFVFYEFLDCEDGFEVFGGVFDEEELDLRVGVEVVFDVGDY